MYIYIHPFAIFETLISRRSDVGPGVILVLQVVPEHAASIVTARLAIVCLDRILFSKYFLQKIEGYDTYKLQTHLPWDWKFEDEI